MNTEMITQPVGARPIDPASPLYARLRKKDTHDHRDTGNALEKNYPNPDWRNWKNRQEFDL